MAWQGQGCRLRRESAAADMEEVWLRQKGVDLVVGGGGGRGVRIRVDGGDLCGSGMRKEGKGKG
jgi:hypothetical protein